MPGNEREHVSSMIMTRILGIRRRISRVAASAGEPPGNEVIRAIQQPRIRAFVDRGVPIEFVLPAFPAKSPNPRKVLGPLPDMAEVKSLDFLQAFCEGIGRIYAPGAVLTICSDGRVFGDTIRVSDSAITSYQAALKTIVSDLGAVHLRIFNLEDIDEFRGFGPDYRKMRSHLAAQYADPIGSIKAQLLQDAGGLSLYRAITRFMFEDGLLPDYRGSRTALQKDSRERALEVIQRSLAWGRVVARMFPLAIRLSIHPQAETSEKIGIHMMPTKDDWLTPWHGVAVDAGGRFVLMNRKEALQRGGQLVLKDRRPSHYVIGSVGYDQGVDRSAAIPC